MKLFDEGDFEAVLDGHGYLLVELLSNSLTSFIFLLYVDGIALVVAHVVPDVARGRLLFNRLRLANRFVRLGKAQTGSLSLLL